MKAKEIDYELMNEWFYYDETSPSCLRWKKVGVYASKVEVGGVAGTLKQQRKGRCVYKHWEVKLKGWVLHGAPGRLCFTSQTHKQ